MDGSEERNDENGQTTYKYESKPHYEIDWHDCHGSSRSSGKALIIGKLDQRELRCGIISILCHALLKKAILLHTEGLVKTEMASTVNYAI